ncbi:MAG: enoyl-CoA hydratase/isomerase family protein [Bdellovibrionaceae bacterium]|nr:enoyl-CoA hydratase/isomerase family protein [Pseudobdellovibrionaceae bacterium]
MIIKENLSKSVAALTLNRAESLNALNRPLIHSLQTHLKDLENDQNIMAIVLKSSISKAFCAGGDIIEVCQDIRHNKVSEAHQFFKEEYGLHILLRGMKTPVIAVAEGFSIGGGLGLLNSCAYRIVTETSQVSMPEALIGFFPDVGASNYLSASEFGLFLGLSSQRIKAADILLCNLADYYIPSQSIKELLNFLSTVASENFTQLLQQKLKYLDQKENLKPGPLTENKKFIREVCSAKNIENFDKQLHLYKGEDPWILKAIENFNYSSKHSLKFIFKQLKQKRDWLGNAKKLFDKEYKMATYFVKHPDLLEGVRALLEDKDKKPSWKEKSYQQIVISEEIFN